MAPAEGLSLCLPGMSGTRVPQPLWMRGCSSTKGRGVCTSQPCELRSTRGKLPQAREGGAQSSAEHRSGWGMWMIWRHQWCTGHSLETVELYPLPAARRALPESSLWRTAARAPSHLPNAAYGSYQEVFRAPCPFPPQPCPFSDTPPPWLIPTPPLFSAACAFADVTAEASAAPQARATLPKSSGPIQEQPCRS